MRLRPTRHGNRRLNAAIHRIAITQTIHDGPGQTYYQRRIAEGDSGHRALKCLKRRLARVIYNRLKNPHPPPTDDPARRQRPPQNEKPCLQAAFLVRRQGFEPRTR